MPSSTRLSRRKDLHDGQSLWRQSRSQSVKTLRRIPAKPVEIAIVGAGISGALIALELSAKGHEVVVFDRREPATGSTLASTALIQFEIDTPLVDLAGKIGQRNATRAYLRASRAVGDLKELIEKHGIDGRWRDRQALYLAGDKAGFRRLEEEAEARQKIGLPSTFLDPQALRIVYGIERTGALISNGSGEIDPVRTTIGCLKRAQELGAKVVSPCTITDVQASGRHCELLTSDEERITARHVIFATGYETVPGVPRDAFEIISSWVIATQRFEPDELWPGRCLIWEGSDPYLYIRTTADNRILIGGEDSKLVDPERRAAAIPAKSQTLLRKAQKLLGRDDLEIEFAWDGAFADSPTGLPVIRPLPDRPGCLAVLGCGGNGITFSMIAAEIAGAWVAGRKDPYQHLFNGD